MTTAKLGDFGEWGGGEWGGGGDGNEGLVGAAVGAT